MAKRKLLLIVRDLFTDLEENATRLAVQGNGAIVHDIGTIRTPIVGHMELMTEALNSEIIPKDFTYERIGDLLRIYERKERELCDLQMKVIQHYVEGKKN
jgi:hypothetical protein